MAVKSMIIGAAMTTRITIRRPGDWHLHVRDSEMLKAVLPFTAKDFGRAILMPNLTPPVCTTRDAIAYRERVKAALPPGSRRGCWPTRSYGKLTKKVFFPIIIVCLPLPMSTSGNTGAS
jgi:hypothetical protein